jgi:hypothetical protein
MDNMTGYYKYKADDLSIKANKLKNLLSLMEAPNRRGQSYRMPDGSYVDEFGTPISGSPDGTGIPPTLLADPGQYPQATPPFTPPNLVSDPNQYPDTTLPTPADPYGIVNPDGSPRQPNRTPGQGFAPTPTGVMPPQPNPAPTPAPVSVPAAPDTSKEDFATARTKYYARRNQQARDEAEENLARISAIDMSKQSASGRSQIAVNKLRAERALKGTKFSDDDINRMVASDTKERFMTPADKAARAERTRAGAAALSAEAEKRYGPGGGVATIDRRGDNKIQGTNMTFNQFKERYGRDYNALNKDDSNLVRGAASNFAVGRVSQSAQQAAQTADAMNQAYSAQNADMAQRSGAADRAVDASQIELDRYRNLTPAQRQAEVRGEIERTQVQPGFVKGVAKDMAAGVSAENARRAAEAERQAFERRAAQPGKVGTPSLLARPEQAPPTNTPPLLRRAEGTPPEAPSLIQAPPPEPPARPRYTGAGSVDFAQPPELLQATGDQSSTYTGVGSRSYSPPPAQRNLGGQVTQRASTMNAQPLTGRVSPTAPVAAPKQPLGATITPARPQAAPAVNTGGMNATGSIDDFDNEQQTGGPSERNRALPQPTATPFVQRPLRGRTVTAAARTFNTRGNATRRLA